MDHHRQRQDVTPEDIEADVKTWRTEVQLRARFKRKKELETEELAEDTAESWKDVLIARLLQVPPDGFERLVQRLLRETGFVNVTVTGKSGDGGIDGMGTYRISLVSFPIYFQRKTLQRSRYS